jgi:CdiI immunity protein
MSNQAQQSYPELDQFIGIYLGQDHGYFADSIEQLVACYKEESSAADHQVMLDEIARFVAAHPTDLDAAFDAAFGADFDPKLWGHTVASFLVELERLLRDDNLKYKDTESRKRFLSTP